uniref:Oxysterol-binding protein n=3 Tax=Hirondellea gigas TaxID=1518452 RepID=A0A6A7FYM3_9CRUS
MDDQLRQPYQGQLVKFTNVVKGWQTRWFILNPEPGTLQYYLSESDLPCSRPRGSIQLAGAVISPSDEDCHTFTVSPASGEAYKLRAQDTRGRQMWLNRMRVIAEMHTRAIAHQVPVSTREHRKAVAGASGISSGPSSLSSSITTGGGAATVSSSTSTPPAPPQPVSSTGSGSIGGLAVMDAFTQVSELLQEAHRHHANLAMAVEELPSHGRGLKCSEPNLLLLKATSQATVMCLDSCLSVLKSQQLSNIQQQHTQQIQQQQQQQQRPRQGSPLHLRPSSPSMRMRATPHSPAPPLHHSQQQPQLDPTQTTIINQKSTSTLLSSTNSTNQFNQKQHQQHHSPLKETVSLNNSPPTSRHQQQQQQHHGEGGATSLDSGLPTADGVSAVATATTERGTVELAALVSRHISTPNGGSSSPPPRFATVGEIKDASAAARGVGAEQLTPTHHAAGGIESDVMLPTISKHVLHSSRLPGPFSSDSEESDGEESSNPSSVNDSSSSTDSTQHNNVIVHIISQLRLGMDLTKVTLPTFILEKRSLLEMYADFLGHPDYFLKIASCNSSEERLVAVVRWYLTSVHVGRMGSQAKKPYNPVIGETFQCAWRVPRKLLENNKSSSGSIAEQQKSSETESQQPSPPPEGETTGGGGQKLPDYVSIKFAAEQVSHHPPVSAFYFECPEKQLCINAHIWTKSKFMGMSVGVNLIGDITLTVGGIVDPVSNSPIHSNASTTTHNPGRSQNHSNLIDDKPTNVEIPQSSDFDEDCVIVNSDDISGSSGENTSGADVNKISYNLGNISPSSSDNLTTNTCQDRSADGSLESQTNPDSMVSDGRTSNSDTAAAVPNAPNTYTSEFSSGLANAPACESTATDDCSRAGINEQDDGGRTSSRKETYTLSMPSAYARSILTEPWAELGGLVNITCLESGCYAPIVFHTKPFYGGCLHRVSGEMKNRAGGLLCKVAGEWDGKMEMTYPVSAAAGGGTAAAPEAAAAGGSGTGTSIHTVPSEVLDVRTMPVVCRKRVRPIRSQGEGESRRLWQDVTTALSRHDIDTATAHKRRLEDLQRAYEAARKTRGEDYHGKLFRRATTSSVSSSGGGGSSSSDNTVKIGASASKNATDIVSSATSAGTEHWVYRNIPHYAGSGCVLPQTT